MVIYAWEVGAHSRLAFGLKWVPAHQQKIVSSVDE